MDYIDTLLQPPLSPSNANPIILVLIFYNYTNKLDFPGISEIKIISERNCEKKNENINKSEV